MSSVTTNVHSVLKKFAKKLKSAEELTVASMAANTNGDYKAGDIITTKEFDTGKGYPATYDVAELGVLNKVNLPDGFHIIAGIKDPSICFVQRDKGDLASALNYPAGLIWGDNRWEVTQPISITQSAPIYINGGGVVLFDRGIEDDDSDSTGRLRRFLGLEFFQCKEVTFFGFILQSDTNKAGNGVIKNSVDYSNQVRFRECTTVNYEKVLLDNRNDKPDSAYRSEATFVDDIMRSYTVYFKQCNDVNIIRHGIAETNNTGELMGLYQVDGYMIDHPYTMKGTDKPSNHSALFKAIVCENGVIKDVKAYTSYRGGLFDITGKNITIEDFDASMVEGGVVDISREWGPAGGDSENIVIRNVSTTGKNLISTADVTSVLPANTGKTYTAADNKISKISVINCYGADDIHPVSSKRAGINHDINSRDIQGLSLDGGGRKIKNPEHLAFELTVADTSLDYDFEVKNYTFYQDSKVVNYDCKQHICGKGLFSKVNFEFLNDTANKKGLLTIADLQLINGEEGITPQNTRSSVEFNDCEYHNTILILQANSKFKNCRFYNCLILDSGLDVEAHFDSDCKAFLIDTGASVVGGYNAVATFIFFQSIGKWSWLGEISGEYVKPAGYGVLASIKSAGQDGNFAGARFDVEARASTSGAPVEDYLICHWDRNDNVNRIKGAVNKHSKNLMVIVRANVGGTSTTSRLEVIGCDTRGKLLRDNGNFTNSTLMMVNNSCNTTNQTGTWSTVLNTPNVVGLV